MNLRMPRPNSPRSHLLAYNDHSSASSGPRNNGSGARFRVLDTSKKLIVVLGGSYAGISTAHYLLRHVLPELEDGHGYQVVLVSPHKEVLWRPGCAHALTSRLRGSADGKVNEDLFVGIESLFDEYLGDDFYFLHAIATKLDTVGRIVTAEVLGRNDKSNNNQMDELLPFHALVIATGASTKSPLLGRVRDHTIRRCWREFGKALKGTRSIVIAGGGPSGVETAGELGELLNGQSCCFKSGLQTPRVSITLVTPTNTVLNQMEPSIGLKAEKYLTRVGVTILRNTRVASVVPEDAGMKNVATNASVKLDSGETLDTHLYIPATGLTPNTDFIDPDQRLIDSKTGHFIVDESLRASTWFPRIYAIGDVASYPHSGSIQSILRAVPVLCKNLESDLFESTQHGRGSDRHTILRKDNRMTQLVTIGPSHAVGMVAGCKVPGFLASWIKRKSKPWENRKVFGGKLWQEQKPVSVTRSDEVDDAKTDDLEQYGPLDVVKEKLEWAPQWVVDWSLEGGFFGTRALQLYLLCSA